MGTFRVRIGIGPPAGDRFIEVDALVDTGATYTWIGNDVLERLHVWATEERAFLLADGRQVTYPIAWVQARIEGRAQPTIAVVGEPGSEALLGVFTLEGFGLAADPVNRRLVSIPALLK